MSAYPWHREFDQGADINAPIAFVSPKGVYTDLAGSSFRATLKADRNVESPALATFTCTVASHPALPNQKNPVATNRRVLLTLDKAVTETLDIGDYHFELWMTDSAGNDSCVLAGVWKLRARGGR